MAVLHVEFALREILSDHTALFRLFPLHTPSPTTRGGQKGENNCGDVLQLLDLLFTCIIESLYTLSGPQGASSVGVVTQFDIDHVAPLYCIERRRKPLLKLFFPSLPMINEAR